jgi:hypothetical protein
MAGLVPAIHVFPYTCFKNVEARDIGERSDAVLRAAMRGHDEVQPIARIGEIMQ